MSQVPVRALNQDTAGILARVKAGEHVAVTERGHVVAYLTPAIPSALAGLVTAGRVHPPTLPNGIPRPLGPVRPELDAGALLEEMRDDERF